MTSFGVRNTEFNKEKTFSTNFEWTFRDQDIKWISPSLIKEFEKKMDQTQSFETAELYTILTYLKSWLTRIVHSNPKSLYYL